MKDLGFIILRHVSDIRSKELWYLSYQCVRKLYPENPILIIDDHSNYNYIDINIEKKLINTTIIENTKPGRGEILPYLYYLENKIAEKIIFLQDSTFITKKIDVSNIKNFKSLWYFKHKYDRYCSTRGNFTVLLSKLLNGDKLIKFMVNENKWFGSTGAQTIISYDYLKKIDNMYDLKRVQYYIKKRRQRMDFERILSIILWSLQDKVIKNGEESYFGDRNPYHIDKLDKINQFLNCKNDIINRQFIAPNIKNSYNKIFRNDSCLKKKKILTITIIDKQFIRTNKYYNEDTLKIDFNINETIESVYYGFKDNIIEVTELFKKYIFKCDNFLDNLGIYKIKLGR